MKTTRIAAIICIAIIMTMLPASIKNHSVPAFPGISPGDTGYEVERVQRRLKTWGYYDSEITGIFNAETEKAVKAFQYSFGLSDYGTVDLNTLITMGLTKTVQTGVVNAQEKSSKDEQLMARAINGEARGESYEGQVAVGAVILNRVRHASFPNTISGVIYQPGAFTAVSDGQINAPVDQNSTVLKAARDALNGWDPTNGCIYYWNPATATSKWIWSRKIVKKIGKHNFGI